MSFNFIDDKVNEKIPDIYLPIRDKLLVNECFIEDVSNEIIRIIKLYSNSINNDKNSFLNLPLEILVMILNCLDYHSILNCSLVCKKMYEISHSVREIEVIVKWRKIMDISHWKNSFRFNIDLSEYDKVTDEGIKALAGVKNIDLSWCNNVTDEGIKALSGVQEIYLYNCDNVTDEGVKALGNVRIYR